MSTTEVLVTNVDRTTIPNMIVFAFEDPSKQPGETHGYYELPKEIGLELSAMWVEEANRTPYPLAVSWGLRTNALTGLAVPASRILADSIVFQHMLARLIGEDAVRQLIRDEELTSICFTEANRECLIKLTQAHRAALNLIYEAFDVSSRRLTSLA